MFRQFKKRFTTFKPNKIGLSLYDMSVNLDIANVPHANDDKRRHEDRNIQDRMIDIRYTYYKSLLGRRSLYIDWHCWWPSETRHLPFSRVRYLWSYIVYNIHKTIHEIFKYSFLWPWTDVQHRYGRVPGTSCWNRIRRISTFYGLLIVHNDIFVLSRYWTFFTLQFKYYTSNADFLLIPSDPLLFFMLGPFFSSVKYSFWLFVSCAF